MSSKSGRTIVSATVPRQECGINGAGVGAVCLVQRHPFCAIEKKGCRVSRREVLTMCDYSLHHIASRPAKVGDKLVTTQFSNSITRGFAAIGEPNVAVCLLPGTEVAFEKEVEWRPFSFGLFRKSEMVGEKVARFRQVRSDQPNTHHDALEFPNGDIVLLTTLHEGQYATVLQLPAQLKAPVKTDTQTREAQVG